MRFKQDWNNSNLAIYLLYGKWSPLQGQRLLAGARPDCTDASPLDTWLDIEPPDDPLGCTFILQRDIDQLHVFWLSDDLSNEKKPPSFFIEWAISKQRRPEWLDWVIEQGLYSTKQDGIADKITPANNVKPYSTKWMVVQEAAIREFCNPRRNPDAKKEEVIDWIHKTAKNIQLKESNNIAEAIFSIIKPENHDPKRKRIEPK